MLDIVLTYFSEHQYILYILLGLSILLLVICIICLDIAERKQEKEKEEFIKNAMDCFIYDFKHRINDYEVARKK